MVNMYRYWLNGSLLYYSKEVAEETKRQETKVKAEEETKRQATEAGEATKRRAIDADGKTKQQKIQADKEVQIEQEKTKREQEKTKQMEITRKQKDDRLSRIENILKGIANFSVAERKTILGYVLKSDEGDNLQEEKYANKKCSKLESRAQITVHS